MKWIAASAAAAIALAAAPADAGILGKYRVRAGIGAQVTPSFPGSKDFDLTPLPKFSLAKDDKPFSFGTHDDSFGIALISTHGFSAGPVARIRSRREETDADAPIGDVERALEVGGFVQQFIGDSVRLRAEVRKGVRGHEGVVGTAGADYIARDGDEWLVSIGPRVRFADSAFMRTYFGIGPAIAARSGLPEYSPGGGFYGVGATSTFNKSLGGRWGLFGYAEYIRLVGDARRSPIVTELGSPDQYSAGVGISYTFDFTL